MPSQHANLYSQLNINESGLKDSENAKYDKNKSHLVRWHDV